MNRIPLYRRRFPWSTGVAAILGLVVIAGLLAWLWRPSKSSPAIPAPLAASAPVSVAADQDHSGPAQARRALAVSGRWSRLSARDQAILAPLEEDWSELSVDQRLKWLDLSLRFPALSPEEQQRIQDRMGRWARMSPAERGAARLNFQETRQLSQKERLEQWEAYQELNPQERKVLALKAQAATQTPAVPRRADPSAPIPKSSGTVADTLAGSPTLARPVGGTLVQAPIGATTRLVTQVPSATPGTSSGPKITAQPGVVDPATLLPQARAGRHTGPAPATGADPTPASGDESVPPAGVDAAGAPAGSTASPTATPTTAPSTTPAPAAGG